MTKRLFGFLLLFAATLSPALANITVSPTRVILEGRDRAATFYVINRSPVAQTYRIEWAFYSMNENGALIPADPAALGVRSAAEFLRVSPRQVTLAPGAQQAVKVAVRKPADLAAGEYRAHLQFLPLPDAAAASDHSSPAGVSTGITLSMSVSVPIYVRHGELTVQVAPKSIAARRLSPHEYALDLELERTGNQGASGTIRVFDGAGRLVGIANGVSIYPDLAVVRRSVAFASPDGSPVAAGPLRVTYNAPDGSDGKPGPLLFEATTTLD